MNVRVRRNAEGVWYARPYLGRTPEGRAVQPYRQFPEAECEEQAREMAEAWARELTACGLVRSAALPDLLADYASMRERNGASPNSVRSYRLFARYAARYLGRANARELTTMDFNRFEQRLLAPKEAGGQGLSRNSVIAVHQFLRGAYGFFCRAGICSANPLLDVDKPAPERREAASLDEASFAALDARLLELMEPDGGRGRGWRAAVDAFAAWLSLRTGMRVGEVCALRPCEVLRSPARVRVCGTVVEERGRPPRRREATKGRRCRSVAVTDGDLARVDAFLAMRRDRLGALGASAPVVTADGSFERPSRVSRAFTALARELSLPPSATFHTLRHTHATWLLANGVDLKTVSERLGHADEATTLRLYAHVLPGRDAAAAEAFGRAASEAGRRAEEP